MLTNFAVAGRRIRRITVLMLVSVIGCFTPTLASQSTPSKGPSQPTTGTAASSSRYLRVTINPSRSNIVEGAVYGLDAELENISDLPVSIKLEAIQLAVQPELAPPDVSCPWFYDAVANSKVPSPLIMQPGDQLTVFFETGSSSGPAALADSPECKATYWGRLRRRLDFVPGNYAFVLTGTLTAPTPTSQKADEHYFTETAILPVTIDQYQMIMYAGLGGLLAFLVVSFRNAATLSEYAGQVQTISNKPFSKFLIMLRQATAAILISVTVTVIVGRLSTTTFPVKVSVEDFWGALTIGFVSFFVGGKFIDKLVGLAPTPSPGLQQRPAPQQPSLSPGAQQPPTPQQPPVAPATSSVPPVIGEQADQPTQQRPAD